MKKYTVELQEPFSIWLDEICEKTNRSSNDVIQNMIAISIIVTIENTTVEDLKVSHINKQHIENIEKCKKALEK